MEDLEKIHLIIPAMNMKEAWIKMPVVKMKIILFDLLLWRIKDVEKLLEKE